MSAEGFDLDRSLEGAKQLPPVIPTEAEFIKLCEVSRRQFATFPNILRISQPVSVAGSCHAQLEDIHEIFQICGEVPYTAYLFIGNFVNYGLQNVATVNLLFCLALKYPDVVYLLRGPHESRLLTRKCGLYEEIINTYGSPRAWDALMDAFDALPIGARVFHDFFCVAGGVSKDLTDMNRMDALNRFMEVPIQGSWAPLMWGKPIRSEDMIESKYGFNEEQLKEFLRGTKLRYLVRSGELIEEGKVSIWNDKCALLWSAPNFGGWARNKGAVLQMLDVPTNKDSREEAIAMTVRFESRPDAERKLPSQMEPNIDTLDYVYLTSLSQ